jgi:hypothetical protein
VKFGWDAVPGALDFAQPLPAIGLDWPAIALANQVVLLKGDDGVGGILIQIVLDQLGDQIVAVKIEKVVPKARNPVRLGDELVFTDRPGWRSGRKGGATNGWGWLSFESSCAIIQTAGRGRPE